MKRSTFISLTTLLAGLHISSWAGNNKINNDLLEKSNPQVSGLTTNKYSVLYSFQGGGDGANPYTGLISGRDGNIYGTTIEGGSTDTGTVFKITPSGRETVLYSFQGGADGSNPSSGLIQDSVGNLYGTTQFGGSANNGTVFKITPSGQETVLYSFQDGSDGNNPSSGLILGRDGNAYGITHTGGNKNEGTVYKITLSGQETVLHSFQGGTDGTHPVSSLIQDGVGNLYGTTQFGGSANNGTVFKITPSGQETVLYSFQGSTDGSAPLGSLVLGSDGNFYGTTLFGGSGASSNCDMVGCGTIFKLTPSGQETVLYSFQGGTDGGVPASSLITDSVGNLYGTASEGGSTNNGTVFRLTVAP